MTRTKDEKMRLAIGHAADALLEYSISEHFDWTHDRDVLLPIMQGCEEVQSILDARRAKGRVQ